MKILYAGGGTMGSVSPLLALNEKIQEHLKTEKKNCETLWLGTINGIEKEAVEKNGIKFEPIMSGKFRRYFDWQNFFDLFRVAGGLIQSFYWLIKFKPGIVLTAGSFVAAPVAYAAFFYGAPVFAHQQDARVGLANKLIAPVAKKITVALEKSLKDFNQKKVVLAGNPVRLYCHSSKFAQSGGNPIVQVVQASNLFNFDNQLPVILILGGGTGALAINELVWQSLKELTKFCNVIHITGKNKSQNFFCQSVNEKYKSFDFLPADQMAEVYEIADIVVSRAGMSTLTELAYFKKPTIIIPMPDSHQEENAEYFAKRNGGIYLKQKELTLEKFILEIKNLLIDEQRKKETGENMNKIFCDYSGEKIIDVVLS